VAEIRTSQAVQCSRLTLHSGSRSRMFRDFHALLRHSI